MNYRKRTNVRVEESAMSFADILKTCFEFILVSFTVWAVFHEDKFIIFEEKLFSNIKRRKLVLVKSENRKSSALADKI